MGLKTAYLIELLDRHVSRPNPSASNLSQELWLAVTEVADTVAAERRWSGYSQIEEWRDHAQDQLVKAAGRWVNGRCKDPLAYFTRVARNAIIDKLRVAAGTRRKTPGPNPRMMEQHSSTQLDESRTAAPVDTVDYDNFVRLDGTFSGKGGTLGQQVPKGKSGVMLDSNKVAWVVRRLDDTDL